MFQECALSGFFDVDDEKADVEAGEGDDIAQDRPSVDVLLLP